MPPRRISLDWSQRRSSAARWHRLQIQRRHAVSLLFVIPQSPICLSTLAKISEVDACFRTSPPPLTQPVGPPPNRPTVKQPQSGDGSPQYLQQGPLAPLKVFCFRGASQLCVPKYLLVRRWLPKSLLRADETRTKKSDYPGEALRQIEIGVAEFLQFPFSLSHLTLPFPLPQARARPQVSKHQTDHGAFYSVNSGTSSSSWPMPGLEVENVRDDPKSQWSLLLLWSLFI